VRAAILLFGVVGLILAGCAKQVRYQQQPPMAGENITNLNDAWVELYSDANFRGSTATIKYPKTANDLSAIPSDEGKVGFQDKAHSVKWQVPEDWQVVLYDDDKYSGNKFPLFGTGKVESNADLGTFAGKASSLRWERKEQ
jgi:hypothetical protein